MTNVEALLVGSLNLKADFQALKHPSDPNIQAFMEVPADRPRRFVTVERVGGAEINLVDRPRLAVQFWAESRYQASEGARLLALILERLAATVPQLGRCKVEAFYNFPDERQARYQLMVVASTVRGASTPSPTP